MRQEQFVARHQAEWLAFETWLHARGDNVRATDLLGRNLIFQANAQLELGRIDLAADHVARGEEIFAGLTAYDTQKIKESYSASFGADPQARIDHAYNSYDKTAVASKSLISTRYGRKPDRSYFSGCSGGGRQGMMFSQRFPDYFDGITAGAPAMRVSSVSESACNWDSATTVSTTSCGNSRTSPGTTRANCSSRRVKSSGPYRS